MAPRSLEQLKAADGRAAQQVRRVAASSSARLDLKEPVLEEPVLEVLKVLAGPLLAAGVLAGPLLAAVERVPALRLLWGAAGRVPALRLLRGKRRLCYRCRPLPLPCRERANGHLTLRVRARLRGVVGRVPALLVRARLRWGGGAGCLLRPFSLQGASLHSKACSTDYNHEVASLHSTACSTGYDYEGSSLHSTACHTGFDYKSSSAVLQPRVFSGPTLRLRARLRGAVGRVSPSACCGVNP